MTRPVDDLCKRFEACMVLSGVGDALGYKNAEWEFCRMGEKIHEEAKGLGGIENVKVNPKEWRISDDTVMHIATAEALLTEWSDHESLYPAIALKYIKCMLDMDGRAPGLTCMAKVNWLNPGVKDGCKIPFDFKGGGCGAAMRAVPIGLYYWQPEHLNNLIAVSIESGRLTHHHPTGYLGALAVALFVSYSIQKKLLCEWGAGLMLSLKTARQYIIDHSPSSDHKNHMDTWGYFEEKWTNYLALRQLTTGQTDPVFDHNVNSVKERDEFYRSLSYSGTGGASGHDAPMIAYEALLNTWRPTGDKAQQWIDLCNHSMLHGGDSDSTGIIAAACWGAMEGFTGVPENHYKELEYCDRLTKLGRDIYNKVNL